MLLLINHEESFWPTKVHFILLGEGHFEYDNDEMAAAVLLRILVFYAVVVFRIVFLVFSS